LRVVPSETLGDDFLVPADADFIIEGIIRPGRRALEGPFGEATKYTGPQVMSPVMEVSALTYREGALWHAFTLGITVFFGWTQEEGALYTAVKRAVPEVLRVYIPESGCGRMIQYIQIKKTHEGQPRKAIFAAFSGCPYSKLIIVVDNDIDIYSDKDVLWALSSRSQWDRDLILVPNCFGQVLDPSSDDGFGTKAGIDATKPVDPHHFAVTSSVPIEAMEDAQLEKLIEPEILAKVPEHRKWR
jgi:2,5-furandicarboxylate decarboxylase 1